MEGWGVGRADEESFGITVFIGLRKGGGRGGRDAEVERKSAKEAEFFSGGFAHSIIIYHDMSIHDDDCGDM